MFIAVVAEKPSVARDIADCLGARQRQNGALVGNGYIVTWAIGHLVTLPQPDQINPAWKTWKRDTLPMIPTDWPVTVIKNTEDQFNVVKKILNQKDVSEVICATDAGREGELIFRYIYTAAKCRKKVKRLWISSLTPAAIRQGFDALRPGTDYDHLAMSAQARSRADWLVGMNLSRAYTLIADELVSVGRVQTPTLAMIVARELSIRNFKPEKYYEIHATFQPRLSAGQKSDVDTYSGVWFSEDLRKKRKGESQDPMRDAKRLSFDTGFAERIASRVRSGEATIASLTSRSRQFLAPLLYDLAELQRHANRLFGFSAQKTLETAQELYEGKKLISYPRTDSRYLSSDVAKTLDAVVEATAEPYRDHLPFEHSIPSIPERFVNDAKVTDHHAIIPTSVTADRSRLTDAQLKLYDLICRRFLSAWLDPHIVLETNVITEVTSSDNQTGDRVVDPFHSTGTLIRQQGWKVLDIQSKKDSSPDPILPSVLAQGQLQDVLKAAKIEKETKPPQRLNDATLLTAMETAGKILDDRKLSDAMRERGLGTSATRAAIIETLIKREFIRRNGKSFEATDKGIRLIESVHPAVKSPEMTGEWEYKLKRMEHGQVPFDGFMREIEDYVRRVVEGIFTRQIRPEPVVSVPEEPPEKLSDEPPDEPFSEEEWAASIAQENWMQQPDDMTQHGTPPLEFERKALIRPLEHTVRTVPEPTSARQTSTGNPVDLDQALPHYFGFNVFRPYQKTVCEAVVRGEDALLVMPTGMGKSLCYQLPGLIRGGTTLIVSPLIALMDDQAQKLTDQGFRAEAVHSGKTRTHSAKTIERYLAGELQFLFIAPERLSVASFVRLLQERPPRLIAIDEAHCISHWGHDFRPDYRLLGDRLPEFKSSPVIAMTATATPRVQDDIVTLLGLPAARRFIHGFRRTNIAVEVAEMPVDTRMDAARDILKESGRRPAIVYTATRRNAEELATFLSRDFPTDVYHAGLPAKRRSLVQTAFLGGKLEVIVATIAFGMGIDKPNIRTVIHAALPGSMEGYYQEIGRAGRDGLPSRAILYHSFADQRIQDFLFQKNYPPLETMKRVFQCLTTQKQSSDDLVTKTRLSGDLMENVIEKLWIHGGAVVDSEENVQVGSPEWIPAYTEQRAFREAQLKEMIRFADGSGCRMETLIRHFGDTGDRDGACGICDVCAPGAGLAVTYRSPDGDEVEIIEWVIRELKRRGSLTTGQLHKLLTEMRQVVRNDLEQILQSLARCGVVIMTEHTFEKGAETIHYRRVALTRDGQAMNLKDIPGIEMIHRQKSAAKTRQSRKKPAGSRKVGTSRSSSTPPGSAVDASVKAALKQWRLEEARRLGVPAFRIFSNQILDALSMHLPENEAAMGAISGVGPSLMNRYGKLILKIIAAVRGAL